MGELRHLGRECRISHSEGSKHVPDPWIPFKPLPILSRDLSQLLNLLFLTSLQITILDAPLPFVQKSFDESRAFTRLGFGAFGSGLVGAIAKVFELFSFSLCELKAIRLCVQVSRNGPYSDDAFGKICELGDMYAETLVTDA